ncbi:hypothetical protein [Streptomyces sp. NPDC050546]|uniref:hypothetical protein n=1 Tax=Streptomyces sp. NPDC050546 TaxID=3365628 RepID=UPI0037B47F03
MTHPAYEPPRARAPGDPLAVALGNATLLGFGYLLLRRRRLTAIAVIGTVVLVDLTARTAATWCEVLLLLWWAAGIAHGWFLARRNPEQAVRRGQRAGTLTLALALVLTAALLRIDAYGIENRVTEAREGGDCEAAVAAQGEVGWGHRLAGAPVVEPGDAVVEACRRLDGAAAALARAARGGGTEDLGRGFGTLAGVLNEPGNEQTVRSVLDTFLDALPTDDSCDTAALTAWLRARGPSHDVLDRSARTAAHTEPAALVGCGDHLMTEDAWQQARTHYQRLLDTYPDDTRAGEARDGVREAGLAIELNHVRGLVEDAYDARSGYCAEPARYGGAPPYRKGSGRALFLGDTEYTDGLPASWRTGDPAKAALVVCADEAENGAAVQTCPYENKKSAYLPHQVTFYKVRVPLKIYELRTGKRLDPRSVQISGESCPNVLRYTSYGTYDLGPGDQFVSTSKPGVRDAFARALGR